MGFNKEMVRRMSTVSAVLGSNPKKGIHFGINYRENKGCLKCANVETGKC